MVIPPGTHSGPLQPSAGSSTTPIDGGSFCSISWPVFLSYATSRPDGHWFASRMTSFLASGSSVSSISPQIFPLESQNRAKAQRSSASLRVTVGPSKTSAQRMLGRRVAVSVPSNLIFVCVLAQNGLFFERPHLQRLYSSFVSISLPSFQSHERPSLLGVMVWMASGIFPETM